MLEAVGIEHTVKVVVFMLEYARQPAVGDDLERFAIEASCAQDRARVPAKRKPLARQREAAFRVVVFVWFARFHRRHPEFRVDRNALVQHVVVVGPVPHKDAPPNPDLRGSKANAWGCVHRLDHVGDEGADAVVDLVNGRCALVKHGLTGDHDGSNCHRNRIPVASRGALRLVSGAPSGSLDPAMFGG